MLEIISLTLLMVFCLIYNKKMFSRKDGSQFGYWSISFIGIFLYILVLFKVDMSISLYLTRLVKPILLWIFGGR